MSNMQQRRLVSGIAKKNRNQLVFRTSTVTSVNSTTVDIEALSGVPFLRSYEPRLGDTVLWAPNNGQPFVAGVLADDEPTAQNGKHFRSLAVVETVAFPIPFTAAPTFVGATAQLGYCLVTNVTATGFDVDVLDHTGASQLGTLDWEARE